MQYKVEEKGPLTKVVQVTVPAADVDAAIQAVALKFRNGSNIPGFRKGKAPLGLVEKQFSRDILPEATNSLIDGQVRGIIDELKLEPAAGVNYDAKDVEKGKEFVYSFTFDAMPEFKLPKYEGFAVEEEEVTVEDSDIEAVIDQARNDFAEPVLIDEKRKPKDGDIVSLDFIFFDEKGENELPGLKIENSQMPVGQNQAMPEFEELIKSIASGEEGEGKIDFPDDFPNPELAGKKTVVKAKVHSIYERKLPEVNDEFAKKLGQFESLEAMRGVIRDSFMQSKKQHAKGEAQKNMLESLLKMTDFPLPPSMLERYVNMSVADTLKAVQQSGKGLESLGKSIKDLHVEAQKEAEQFVRTSIFLYKVARVEDVKVEEEDLVMQLRQMAAAQRRPFEEVRDEYIKNNMLGALHERLLADKVVQAMYDKASVTFVKPGKKADAKAEKKTVDKKDDDSKEKEAKKTAAKKEAKPAGDENKADKAEKSAEKKPKAPAKKAEK